MAANAITQTGYPFNSPLVVTPPSITVPKGPTRLNSLTSRKVTTPTPHRHTSVVTHAGGSKSTVVSHPSTSSSSSSGLSTGAKIGIGVGVPLAVIIIAALAFFLYRRRQRSRRQTGLIDEDKPRDMSDEASGGLPGTGHAAAVPAVAPSGTESSRLAAEADGVEKPPHSYHESGGAAELNGKLSTSGVSGVSAGAAELGEKPSTSTVSGVPAGAAELGAKPSTSTVSGVPSGVQEIDGTPERILELDGETAHA